MPSDNSITMWFDQLRLGDEQAANQLWQRYFDRLVTLARKRLGGTPNRVVDEEDVAVSVFDALCRGAVKGNFPDISDRDDLWRMLLSATRRKAIDHVRYANRVKRGGGAVRSESVLMNSDQEGGMEALAEEQPTPELLSEMDENLHGLLALLRDDTLRQIAVWRMQGFSNEEMAVKLDVTVRTVERKLSLIRSDWSAAIGSS